MATGYLVTLGDGVLDPGDVISGTAITFTDDVILGDGRWTFTGGGFTDESEPGRYILATDGNTYFVPDLGAFGGGTTINGTVETVPVATEPTDGTVSGTGGDDFIAFGYDDDPAREKITRGADTVEAGDGNDTIATAAGDDTIEAGDGNDTVSGGAGDDTIDGDTGNDVLIGDQMTNADGEDSISGGAGDDVIYGDSQTVSGSTAETTVFQWSAQGVADEADVSDGLSGLTDNGDVRVSLSVDEGANFSSATMETTDALFDYNGLSDRSAINVVAGVGGASGTAGDAGIVRLDFSAGSAGFVDEVEDVTFGVFDLDEASGQWNDQIIVRAYDADGTLIPVTLTLFGQTPGSETIVISTDANGTATATAVPGSTNGSDNADNPNGTVQVFVAGPVAQIEIEYNNTDPAFDGQFINIGDIQLTSIPAVDNEGANDTLDGGTGNDEIFGQGGDDSIQGGAGEDSLFGGDGNDIIDDSGTTADTIDGGAGNDTITAGGGADSVAGGDGQDSIRGEGGNDEIFGGAGNDNIRGDGGNDEVFGGADNDTLAGDAGNDTLDGGAGDDDLSGDAGNDTLISSAGDDTNFGGTGNDTFVVTDDSDGEVITGGEDTGDGDIDVVTFSSPTSSDGVSVTYTGNEAGTYDFDGTTADGSFTQIERLETTNFDDTIDAGGSAVGVTVDTGAGADTITSGDGDDAIDLGTNVAGTATDGDADVVVLEDGFGDDIITNLDAPTVNDDGTFTGIDTFDTTALNDSEGVPVNTNDVTVSNDGSGNAVLTFPNGESVTLIGISPTDADNPQYLAALGIPLAPAEDGVVTGTDTADTINAGYTGDPDGDLVDADDQLIAGESANDDIIVAQGGADSVEAGAGNDDVYGGDGSDTIDAGAGDDTVYGDTPDDQVWFYEYYDLDPTGAPANLAEAGFANGTSNYEGIPTDVGYTNSLAPALIDSADDYALRFSSTLIIDTAGDYTFAMRSDDGARIFIDGVEVVDHDGLHSATTVVGAPVALTAGEHVIEIIYFENDGGNVLTPTISGPDTGDVATQLSGYDNLRVATGDDVITGGTGDDALFGGTGSDQFNIAEADDTDTITGGEDADGNDVDTVTFDSVGNTDGVNVSFTGDEAASYQVGTTGSDGTFTEIERIVGTDNADTVDLSADSAGITVETGAGADSVTSGAGNDVIDTGTGTDRIFVTENNGTDTIVGGENTGDVDVLTFEDVSGSEGVSVTLTGDEDGTYQVGAAGSDGTFSEIEGIRLTDNADTIDLSANTTGFNTAGGAGNDTFISGQGGDTISGETGDDTITLNTAFGDDTIVGGEDAGGGDVDVLDAMGITSNIVLDLTAPETGTLTTAGDTATFSEIEEIALGSGDDTVTGSTGNDTVDLGEGADTINAGTGDDVIDLGEDSPGVTDGDADVIVLEDSFGDDIVTNFDAPTPNGDGTFTGIDTLDVSNLNDTTATPVTVSDVTVTDDGSGNAVLSFPAGESITLVGIDPVDAADPNYLIAIGIPSDPPLVQDGIVSGDNTDNTIDLAYSGDPDGDFVDADDALLTGEVDNDDIIEGLGGDDSIIGGDGDDQIFGDAAADPDAGIGQPAGQLFTDASNIQAGSFDSASGTSAVNDAKPGDSIIFENAATLANGDDVAIRITVVSISDPNVTVILNDSQASSPLRVVGTSAEAGESVEFRVEFLDQVTGLPLTLSGNATIVDIDDNPGAGNEFVSFSENDITSYSVDAATSLTVSPPTNGVITASGTTGNGPTDEDAWFGVGFEDTTQLNFTVGVVENTANYGFSGLDLTDPVTTSVSGGNDTIDGGVGDDYIAGNGGDDVLTGGEGDDTVLGGTGTDTIFGGSGDTIIGGEDADGLDVDVLNAGAAVSVAYTDVDGNPVTGPSEYGTVTYVDGTTLTFSEIETLNLTILDGTVSGGAGGDLIDGSYLGDPDGDIVDNDDAILAGDTDNDDLIEANGGDDTVLAGDGDDLVFGGTGNDTLDGGVGDDTLLGGTGDDTITIGEDDGTDAIVGNEDSGDADVDTVSYDDVANTDGVNVTFSSDETGSYQVGTTGSDGIFTEIEAVVGTDNADTVDLSGDSAGIIVDAGAGDDTVTSGQGNDDIETGTGDDLINIDQADGVDAISGGEDAGDGDVDTVSFDDVTNTDAVNVTFNGDEAGTYQVGTSGSSGTFDEIEAIVGTDNADTVDLSGDSDGITVTAGAGDDTVTSGQGNDIIDAGTGDDLINIDEADGIDTISGGEDAGDADIDTVSFDDVSTTDAVNVTFTGDEAGTYQVGTSGSTGSFDEIEAIVGSDNADTVDLSGDSDGITVDAGAGDDTITSGQGDDVLTGGTGDDVFNIDETDGTDTITGGEDAGNGDTDTVDFSDVTGPDGVTITYDGAESADYAVGAGTDGTFDEIEAVIGTDNADTVDATLDTAGIDATTGAGNDTITGGSGNDDIDAGTGDDTIALNDGFGDDTIVGGEDTGDADVDVLDGSGLTEDVTVDLTAPETGTITNGADTATFSEIEEIVLGSGDDSVTGSAGNDTVDLGQGTDTINAGEGDDVINLGEDSPGNPDQDPDVVVLEDGFGDDIVTNFDAPTPGVGPLFVGVDTLDVTNLFDAPVGDPDREPVNTNDVVVTDDGSGNAVLTFPNGESLTLVGIPPADADNPFYLNAIGIPMPDGTVSGSAGGDLIDGSYLGDPDGDIVDNDDAILAGDTLNDDLIEANGGDDTVFAGDGNDEVYGGTGNDTLDGGVGNDTLFGEAGNDIITIGEADGTDAITGGEDVSDADLDIVDFSDVSGAEGVDVDFTGNEAGDYQVGAAGSDGTFTEIEGIIGSDNADDINLSGDTTGISVDAGTGDDVITGGTGDDVIDAGAGQDDVIISDNFGNDDITGGEAADGTGDVLDGSALTQDVTVNYSGSETGTIDNGADTADFAEIEEIVTGTGDDTVIGGTGNDVVSTGSGVDTIEGGAGNDVFDAGAGDDTIDGGTGNDSITAGTGDDTVQLTDNFGDDTIVAGEDAGDGDVDVLDATGVTDDTTLDLTAPETGTITDGAGTASLAEIEQFFLGSGDDTATGSTGDDFIDLGQGDDTIDAGQGDDTVAGGLGDDAIILSNLFGNDTITGGEDAGGADIDILDATGVTDDTVLNLTAPETGTITDGADTASLAEIEEFFLGSGDDSATGSTGNDTIDLGAGDDSINAGTGDDSVSGGTGDDTVAITDDFGNDTVDAGEDVGGADVDVLDGSGLTDDVTVTLTGDEVGTVTDGVDTLSFTNVEEIVTGAGDDTVIGGTGDDSVSTGAGIDTITGGAGNDTFDAGAGDDTIDGGLGDDSITAGTGDDTVVITDDFGNDTVEAGEDVGGADVDVDVLDGSGLTDDVTVTLTGDEVGTVTDGTDTLAFDDVEEIVTGSGDDTIVGGAGDDSVTTGAGNDIISGGEGADTFDAGDGNDTITFAEGDSVDGGDGDDTFVLEDLGEPTNGVITVVGGDGDESPITVNTVTGEVSGGDILELGDLADLSTLVQTSDGINASGNETFSGSVELDDGTLLNFSGIEQVICFTPGTNIATPLGSRPIETLQVGDMVVTRDHGLQPIRWIQSRTVPATDKFAPVRLRPGTVTGLERDLLVSPQHRMLFQGYRAELLFGESEVLMPATHLIDDKMVTREEGGFITYIHMMFDEHEVVYAEGAASESFHPGEIGLTGVSDAAREELFALFPQLRSDPKLYGRTARRTLKKHESQMLRTK